MINLESIDLTQGKRFERILHEKETNKYVVNNDNGARKLRKGEIPHHISTDGLIEFTPIDWEWSTSWINDITATTTTLSSSSWYTFSSWIDTDNIVNNAIIDYPLYGCSNTYRVFNNKTTIDKPSIESRIKSDPFSNEHIHDIRYRLKKEYNDRDDLRHSIYSIHNRLSNAYKSHDYSRYDDDILTRLYQSSDEDTDELLVRSSLSHDLNPEHNLKIKAPFIKRVYTTNRGHSFDSKELQFDMIIAKEHFDSAIEEMRR